MTGPGPATPQTAAVADALRHAEWLLARDPAAAKRQAAAILEAVPGHPKAVLLSGTARLRLGDLAGARAILEPMLASQPRAALVHQAWASLLAQEGDVTGAIGAMRSALALKADLPDAWRELGDLLFLTDQLAAADAAYARHLRLAVHDPGLMAAGDALCNGDLPRAEQVLRDHLKRAPSDVSALRMLAEVGIRLGRYGAAETLLAQCLTLAPGFVAARYNYALVLYRLNRPAEALGDIERASATEPHNANFSMLLAACLASTGEYQRAIDIYAGLIARSPCLPRIWLGYGHALRTAGQRDAAIGAYRRAIELAPTLGEAWWSLANLKIGVLTTHDVAAIKDALRAATVGTEEHVQLAFALGRALEERGSFSQSFIHYAAGAAARRPQVSYDAAATTRQVDRTIALMTREFLVAREQFGCPDPSPIFVVGLPRSGSTLIEQMLASHPLVEGTMELPELANIARALTPAMDYPECIASIEPDAFASWGRRYLAQARLYRKTDRPFFVDKMPNNWIHTGLIRLIAPNSKIVDARRGAMAACFSTFKQYFPRGQHYSYDLTELGRYYVDYQRLMAHFDAVAPGLVHRVHYESMVDATEHTLRALLTFCGLDFDPACLRFFDNDRPVRTASSEQVRRPIFREGLDHWKHFAPWLGPLRAALGQIADRS